MTFRKIFIVATVFFLTGAAAANTCTERLTSATQTVEDGERILNEIQRFLPQGTYQGKVPGENVPCTIQAAYGLVLNVSGSRADFQPNGRNGSSACLDSQACFSVTGFMSRVVDSQITADSLKIRIKTPRNGEAGPQDMTIAIQRQPGKTLVTIEERVGIWNLGRTTLTCEF